MTYPLIVIENVRSAYNVGNIIRTADALGYHVVLSGYTASPDTDHRIHKTALGAQDNLEIIHFWDTKEAL